MRKFKIGWREVISMAADAITVSVVALNPALQETLLRGHEPITRGLAPGGADEVPPRCRRHA